MLVKQGHKPPFFLIKNIWFIHVYTTHENGDLGDWLLFFTATLWWIHLQLT